MDASFANLRSKLDALSMLQAMVLKGFVSANISFPVTELQKFAWSLNEGILAAFT